MSSRVFVTALGRVSAGLDGSDLGPDPALQGRPSARAPFATPPGQPRLHALALEAARRALSGAPGLAELDPLRLGVFLSSSKGGVECFDGGPHPELGPGLARYLASAPGQGLRRSLGWGGGGRNTPLACATGAYSLGLAFEEIRAGRLQGALAGAAEASLTPLVAAAFAKLGVLAPAGARDWRGPFDLERRGFALGEGAAALLLEGEEALARSGHRPLAELRGWACTCDAWDLAAPEPQGRQAARAMREALVQAKLVPREVSYVNAHGTGTSAGDAAEVRALRAVFGPAAGPRVSSVKGALGHTLGAAGALEAAVTVESLACGRIPPNRGCREPIPELADWLALEEQALSGRVALSLSMGFGGHNVALVFSSSGAAA